MVYTKELSFSYRNPTRIVFGQGSALNVALEMEALGGTRALIVTDEGLMNTDLPERIREALGDKCVGIFGEVQPDSGVHIVQRGVEVAQERGADILVSLGGGSSIDTAKAMTIVLKEGGKLTDYLTKLIEGPLMPHIAIPTTSGTGSEVTWIAVVKDHEQGVKHLFLSDQIFPKLAILDPEMTVGLPPLVTASTGMDAMCHAVEGIASVMREPIADALNLYAIRLIMEYLPRCVEKGDDLLARGQQMIAATMAGVGFGNSLLGIVHAMAHVVGGRHGIPHGIANGILLPYGMRYNLDVCPDRYALVAEAMAVREKGMSEKEAATSAADAIWEFTKRMGHPQRLRDVGVPKEDLEACATATLNEANMLTNPRPGELNEVLKMLQEAW
ncbi:NAD-dependent methanol dehydrogenase [subsurface metagenome]